MVQTVLKAPLHHSSPFNTGNSTELGDNPKTVVEAINAMFTELYGDVAAVPAAVAALANPTKYTKNTASGATTAAAGDMTGAMMVYAEYSAVGAANLTTRTAAQLYADAGLAVGSTYTLRIINSSGGTTTLLGGLNVTITGTATMATETFRDFLVTITSATAISMQSIGTGTNS
jgi:heptaprenylglyceryl phosphate synthase